MQPWAVDIDVVVVVDEYFDNSFVHMVVVVVDAYSEIAVDEIDAVVVGGDEAVRFHSHGTPGIRWCVDRNLEIRHLPAAGGEFETWQHPFLGTYDMP